MSKSPPTDRTVPRPVDRHRRHYHGIDSLHADARQNSLDRSAQTDRCANTVILGLILQQALILGVVGFGIAYLVGQQLFPMFPRRVILAESDLLQLAGIVLAISVLSSLLGIWKAMKVSPNEALT
ncbi:MAG: ABC transporter permease [Pirellulaceae bacterium]